VGDSRPPRDGFAPSLNPEFGIIGGFMLLKKAASWLTARRLRAHGIILALCLWSVYLWNMSTRGLIDRAGNLKGTDFLHFYTLGSIALTHHGIDLYNMRAQAELAAQRVPAAAGIGYLSLYPPQVSILFAPYARLSYPLALTLWLLFSAIIYGLCCYSMWRVCSSLHNHGFTVLVLAFASPVFWHLIAWGQTSALALAFFVLAFFTLRQQYEFLAGLAFGCLIFKPQLALAVAIVFLITFRRKIVAGALLSAAAELIVAWLYYGPAPLREWFHILVKIPSMLPLLEPKPYQTHCLRTFWTMLVPVPSVSLVLYVITAVVVAGFTIACWRSRMPLSLRYSALLLSTVLLAPHLTVYDLVILAPAFLLVADWLMAEPGNAAPHLKVLLLLAFTLPLIGPLARWTHFQLSVPVMAALLYGIWTTGRKSVSTTTQSD
jgi:hypothetical protein